MSINSKYFNGTTITRFADVTQCLQLFVFFKQTKEDTASVTSRHTSVILKMAGKFPVRMSIFRMFGFIFCLLQ